MSLRDVERIEVEGPPCSLSREPASPDEDLSLAAAKRHHVERVLALHRGNVTAAATALGVRRNTVARWIERRRGRIGTEARRLAVLS